MRIEHWASCYADRPGQWHVFTDLVEDEGRAIIHDIGPFRSQRAAELCAKSANHEGIEELDRTMVSYFDRMDIATRFTVIRGGQA